MDIPSKYNPKEVEEKLYKTWTNQGFFNAKIDPLKKPFTVVIPPPNVTGILHMGHALNNTIQDVLIRYKRMQGYEALWMPGTDHAGIATQNVVEKKLAKQGVKRQDLGREKFVEQVWQWKEEYGSTIISQLKKLGFSCDWQRIRFTMDEEYSRAVKAVFVKLWNKDLIYQGNKVINWCPRCQTALSDEEAPRQEINGNLYYIKYFFKDDTHKFITVATTRPETMLGDTAVMVNPLDDRYKELIGKKLVLPLIGRIMPIIADSIVDQQFGTGAVKVTPAHDPNDYVVGRKHNLEFINIMHPDAKLNSHAGKYSGMDRFKAREIILEDLKEKELLEKIEPHKLAAGHCYRCNTLIEPYFSKQWFVRMKPLASPAIAAVKKEEIKFHPERWTKVYLNWMENIQDWCISRQIWWGHRLPIYYCAKCQAKTAEDSELSKKGIIVSEIKPEKCPDCGNTDLIQDEDVLDTWFSSWLWPFATFYWPPEAQSVERKAQSLKDLQYFYPTDTLVTASEILFFWVARMIMAGYEFMGDLPFKNVYIHGTVRDSSGKKMSKSLGNIIDPLDVIDKFGADSLRFSLMLLAASGSDIYLSDDKFIVGRNFANKIWNATRFMLMKIEENNLTIDNLNLENIDAIDTWVIKRLNTTIKDVSMSLEKFAINEAVMKIYTFFWHDLCDWYIEIIKDDFNLSRAKILINIFIDSMKLLHPVMPFITEEVMLIIKGNTSVQLPETIMVSSWPKEINVNVDAGKLTAIEEIFSTISEIRNIKADLGIGQKKTTLEVKPKCDGAKILKTNESWVKRLSSCDNVVLKDALSRTLYKSDSWDINIDIADMDVGIFLASLDKKIKEADNVFARVSARLRNEKFIENASEDVIAEEKNKFESISVKINRLNELKNAFN